VAPNRPGPESADFESSGESGRVVQQLADHGRDELHMGELLGADGHQHVLVLAGQPAVPPLVQVLHGDGHLAPLAAQDLLEATREHGVGGRWSRLELQSFLVDEH
jgi:hypothetical protein